MILQSEETNTEFELRVLGYQFPQNADDEWDSNWLLVNIRVSAPQGSWSVTDPCLLTWESHWLLNWLADVAVGECQEDMSFLESNILFQLTGRSEDALHLRIELKDELSQRGVMTEEADPPILLAVSVPRVRQAIAELYGELRLFPVRSTKFRPCRPYCDRRTTCLLCRCGDVPEDRADELR
jgi:hypothetical protein